MIPVLGATTASGALMIAATIPGPVDRRQAGMMGGKGSNSGNQIIPNAHI